jgi:hypothetical protein
VPRPPWHSITTYKGTLRACRLLALCNVFFSRASPDAQIYTNNAASLAENLTHDVTKASVVDIEIIARARDG